MKAPKVFEFVAAKERTTWITRTPMSIRINSHMQEVPVSSLQPGDRVVIRPGAKIPVDGVITEGESSFNEAMLTSESLPVSKKPGDVVIGGAIHGAGAVTIEVRATGEKTYLSQVIEMVRQAQANRSRTQDLANRAALVRLKLKKLPLPSGPLNEPGGALAIGTQSIATPMNRTVADASATLWPCRPWRVENATALDAGWRPHSPRGGEATGAINV